MQPYIYTMPQQFVEDAEVPARWRVLAVLNGFFINNKKCWASNEWIGEKIKAHKDTVSQGVKELEELGLIGAERTRRTRLIYPLLKSEIGDNAYLDPPSTPISDRHQRLSNSVSNAVNIIPSESNDSQEPIYIKTDEEGNPVKEKPRKVKQPLTPFDFDRELQKLEESNFDANGIIAFYFKQRGFRCENYYQFKVAVNRHLRAAKNLTHFTDSQIVKGAKMAKELTSEWTLETVLKCLTK